MINLANRNKIVSSYANVLVSILEKSNDASAILNEIKDSIKNIDTSKLVVNHSNIKEYKQIDKILKTKTDNNSELSKFFYRIFTRRYCFLLENIVKKAEEIMKNELDYCNVVVSSKNAINDIMQQNILKVLKSETDKDIKIAYQQNQNLDEDEIEIKTNDKICVISVQSVVKSVLK